MPTYSTVLPSGGSNGRPIKIGATSSPGTLFHQAHATAHDEIYLYVFNTSNAEKKVTIELGGTTSPDDTIEQRIPPEAGKVLVVRGIRLSGSVNIRAFAETADILCMVGNINRIT
jgi:hypothetical protein